MSHRSPTRSSSAPLRNGRTSVHDGVACGAGTSPLAMEIPLNGEPVIEVIQDDPDRFDTADCSIYFLCGDCGSETFRHNQCAVCGSIAPWAAKLGCGLA